MSLRVMTGVVLGVALWTGIFGRATALPVPAASRVSAGVTVPL